jgi:hypothetical protein
VAPIGSKDLEALDLREHARERRVLAKLVCFLGLGHEDAHDYLRPVVDQAAPLRQPPRAHPGGVCPLQEVKVVARPLQAALRVARQPAGHRPVEP